MKKNRPGTLVSVLTFPQNSEVIEEILLLQSSTLGVRKTETKRKILDREFKDIDLYGERVNVKIAKLNGKIVKASPEFEDIKKLALKTGLSIRSINNEAMVKFKQIHFKDE